MSRFQMSPVGQTEVVSAICSQNGHGSHSLMPSVSQVHWLITFTLDPPSIIILGTSLPLMMTITVGLLMSTTVGPSSELEKNDGVASKLCGDNANFNPSINLGTNCKSQPSGSIIWHCCKACHVGLLSVLPIDSSTVLAYSFNSSMFLWLACCIHSMAYFRSASHSTAFPFDLVVTCCTSITSVVTLLTAAVSSWPWSSTGYSNGLPFDLGNNIVFGYCLLLPFL